MRWKILALALVVVAGLSGAVVAYETVVTYEMKKKENIVTETGTVVFLSFEGGFFGIIGDNGKHYDPINWNSEFMMNGTRVHFTAKIRPDLGSYHMWGIIVEILNIQPA
jgi:inhibitor of cysteine peptidase